MIDHPQTAPLTESAWREQAVAAFGSDELEWRFQCPICGHVQSVRDYKEAGAPVGAVGFSCIGRWVEGSRRAFGDHGQGPCDYAGGGLFGKNPVAVMSSDGRTHRMFAFAEMLSHD